jgi:hypothetical protein
LQSQSRPQGIKDSVTVEEKQDHYTVRVDKSIPKARAEEKSSVLGYPKVQALVDKASDDANSPDLSLLLRLPTTEHQSRLLEQAITDFNVTNCARHKTAEHHDMGEIDPVNTNYLTKSDKMIPGLDLKVSREPHVDVSSLFEALMKNIEISECGFNHVAKLQIRDPVGSADSSHGLQHKLFVSSCMVEEKWQETTCRVVTRS